MPSLSQITDRRLKYWLEKCSRWAVLITEWCAFIAALCLCMAGRSLACASLMWLPVLLAALLGPVASVVLGRKVLSASDYFRLSLLRPCIVLVLLALLLAAFFVGGMLHPLAFAFVGLAVAVLVGLTGYELCLPCRKWLYRKHHRFMQGLLWVDRMGRRLDWDNPRDINEKIQWLMCSSDTSLWTRCADKHAVRDFVKERGLADILLDEYGCWEQSKDIDWDSLPEKAVLKCTHDCGSTVVVDRGAGFDREAVGQALDKALKVCPGYAYGEMFYNGIPPRIIAEQFVPHDDVPYSQSAVDYKVWCFDGSPEAILAIYGRTRHEAFVNVYDTDWRVHPEWSAFSSHFRDGGGRVERPAVLDEMLSAAAALSRGFPEVRVDFYVSHGRLWFGEMTFSSNFGMMDYFTDDYLRHLGDCCKL